MEEWIEDYVSTGKWHAVAVAVVLLIATSLIARAVVRLVRKLLSTDGAPLPASSLIVNIVRTVIWALGGSFILNSCFGINVGGLVTAVGVGGIALSLGLQDTISNFFGGLQVTLMKIVQPGDHIKMSLLHHGSMACGA